jgi:hypothetical protein
MIKAARMISGMVVPAAAVGRTRPVRVRTRARTVPKTRRRRSPDVTIDEADMSERDDIGRARAGQGGGYGETRPMDPSAQARIPGAGYGGAPAPTPGRRRRRIIDAARLWSGGVLAGVVAAGVALVGLLIARGVLDIPVLIERKGHLVNASMVWYAVVAFLAGLIATGLLHLLLAGAPQPYRFFGWIVGLATAIAVLVPFTTGAELQSQIAVALINLAIGVCIGSIVSGIGRSAARVLDEPYGY